MRVKVNYTGGNGVSKFATFTTDQDEEVVLEGIGQVTSRGSLFTLRDENGRHVISIPGRRIESVEIDS